LNFTAVLLPPAIEKAKPTAPAVLMVVALYRNVMFNGTGTVYAVVSEMLVLGSVGCGSTGVDPAGIVPPGWTVTEVDSVARLRKPSGVPAGIVIAGMVY
jgi:hypothetical protein